MAPNPWLDWLLDSALSPWLWLGVVLALLLSALFTAWRGGGLRRFPLDFLAALVGFGGGHFFATLMGLKILRIGELQFVWAILGAVLALFAGRALRDRFVRRTPGGLRPLV